MARMAAGLQLKNQLTSKDPTVKLSYQQRWLNFPEDIRNYIKKNVSKQVLSYRLFATKRGLFICMVTCSSKI